MSLLREKIAEARQREARRKLALEYPRLANHPLLECYPASEYLTKHELDDLRYWRWYWRKRGFDR